MKRLREILFIEGRLAGLCMLIAPRWTLDRLADAMVDEFDGDDDGSLAA